MYFFILNSKLNFFKMLLTEGFLGWWVWAEVWVVCEVKTKVFIKPLALGR
jgi:hypothetical protein